MRFVRPVCLFQQNCVGVFICAWTSTQELLTCTLKKTPAFGWRPFALTLDHRWLGVDNECRCWLVNGNLYVKGLASSVRWPRPSISESTLSAKSDGIFLLDMKRSLSKVCFHYRSFSFSKIISLFHKRVVLTLFLPLCHASALWKTRISGWIGSSKLRLNQ